MKVDEQDTYGQVVEIKGKKAIIESNSLRMNIEISRLQKTKKKALPASKTKENNHNGNDHDAKNTRARRRA